MNVSDSGLVLLNILMDLAPAPHKTFNKSFSVFNSPFTPLSPSSLRLYLLFIYPFFHFLLLLCCLLFSPCLFFILFILISFSPSFYPSHLSWYSKVFTSFKISSVSNNMSHGLINYKDTKAKCRQKSTCKGSSRQVIIRVYILEIQSVMLVISTQFCELVPLEPSFWFNSPPPPSPFPVSKYSLYRQCMDGR